VTCNVISYTVDYTFKEVGVTVRKEMLEMLN